MADKTLTRIELCEAVHKEVGLSKEQSRIFLELVISEMMTALGQGDCVKISTFGSFSVREKGERLGRNPKTGEEVPIAPRRVVTFRPSHVLRNRINTKHVGSD